MKINCPPLLFHMVATFVIFIAIFLSMIANDTQLKLNKFYFVFCSFCLPLNNPFKSYSSSTFVIHSVRIIVVPVSKRLTIICKYLIIGVYDSVGLLFMVKPKKSVCGFILLFIAFYNSSTCRLKLVIKNLLKIF